MCNISNLTNKNSYPLLGNYTIKELYKIKMPNLDFHPDFSSYYVIFLKKSDSKKNNTSDLQNDRHCDKLESPLC